MFRDIIDKKRRRGGVFAFILALAVFICPRLSAEEVTGWADETIAVDASGQFKTVSGSVAITHDTSWCTVTNVAGAVPVLKAVTAPDTANAVTTTVAIADLASPVAYDGSGYMRFILCAELDGETVGEALVSDVSFGTKSAFSAAAAFDGRTNALQEVINAKATTSLRYDLLWGNVASNAEISLVCVRRKKNGDILDVKTNGLYDVDTFHADNVDFSTARLQWGDYRLLLQEYAADGTLLLEMFSPEFSIPHIYGTCFIIR